MAQIQFSAALPLLVVVEVEEVVIQAQVLEEMDFLEVLVVVLVGLTTHLLMVREHQDKEITVVILEQLIAQFSLVVAVGVVQVLLVETETALLALVEMEERAQHLVSQGLL
jgi:hypothetical protein